MKWTSHVKIPNFRGKGMNPLLPFIDKIAHQIECFCFGRQPV